MLVPPPHGLHLDNHHGNGDTQGPLASEWGRLKGRSMAAEVR